ncbi:DgyrCDS11549 [Dimorphilus gyrociliatus]|uniref:DgyrCDS11549 n=1 Tax=Dimorphilus gyrociliatus TaxID=2664684 RepID=A0A7I8W3P1_9ANNE|nr:DgyrCDS11549 [Dimorphilus gyrociliatus]
MLNEECDKKINELTTEVIDIRESIDIILKDIGEIPEYTKATGDVVQSSNGSIEKNLLPVFCQEIERNDEEIREPKTTFRAFEKKIHEYKDNLSSLKKEIIMKDLIIKEQRLLIENLRNTSYDGTLIFKLDKFESKKRQAQMNKLTSYYSVPFYTSRTGYKMCIRVYPNGDGNGRGTHLSVFFVVMRGSFDALQRWPFNKKVTFILLDQTDRAEHVTDAFRPDPSSNSFKRPTTEMNIASGSPVFISQTILAQKKDQYLKDDCLFLKVLVDTSSG